MMKSFLPDRAVFVYIRDLLKYSRYRAGLVLVLLFFSGTIRGMSIMLLIPLLHFAGILESSATSGIPNQFMQFLEKISFPLDLEYVLLLYIAIVSSQSFLQNWQQVISTDLCQGFVFHLRNRLYKLISRSDWLFVLKSRNSDITHVLTGGIDQIGSGTFAFFTFINNINIAIVHILLALIVSPIMTTYAVVCGVVLLIALKPLNHQVARASQKLYNSNSKVYNFITEYLRGMKVAKSHGEEETHVRKFEATSANIKESLVDFSRVYSYTRIGHDCLSVIVISVLFFVAIKIVYVPIPDLILLLFIFSRLQPQISTLQKSYQNLLHMLPAYKDLNKLEKNCALSQTLQDSPSKSIQLKEKITFNRVYFAYDKDSADTLSDLSFVIPTNKITAIVGPSGAGKTTILDLLLGLLSPSQGKILVDKIPLSDCYFQSWHEQVSYISQDNFLYYDTVRKNLVMSKDNINDEEIWKSLKLVGADTFIKKLPSCLDTFIGDGGAGLSGGEKQRLILARALLRKPRLLILDEAMSALDAENIKQIQIALGQLSTECTIVIITHRLDTIQYADQIIVLEDGQVIEQGSRKDLLCKKEGRLHDLLRALDE